jgi:hypothetical protein
MHNRPDVYYSARSNHASYKHRTGIFPKNQQIMLEISFVDHIGFNDPNINK